MLCKEGYKLTNSNKECESKIPHCKIYDFNYENCEECEEGIWAYRMYVA